MSLKPHEKRLVKFWNENLSLSPLVKLDNRIWLLQQRKDLTSTQREVLHQADVAYLQDRDDEARSLIDTIENQLTHK